MRQNRPEGRRGQGDRHLLQLSRDLQTLLREVQGSLTYSTLRLRKPETAQLAEILVEFAEDLYNDIGMWAAYERYNTDFFGAALPFAPSSRPVSGIHLDRIRHLLWIVYPELIPGLVLSPSHRDLEQIAQASHAFLCQAFRSVPKGSGVEAFLGRNNQYGWDVKRKLIWLGTQSYMFRLQFKRYLEENNRGRWEIGHVDDFLCQECTRWSGLGAIDILAGVLDISADDRRELRGWYERHASFYRIDAANDEFLDAINVVSEQPYRIRIDMPDHPFKPGQLVGGSLVLWRGDWYWSGEQEIWDGSRMDVPGLCDTMKRQSSHIVCRFWRDYEAQVSARAEQLHKESLAFHGTDMVVYPNGLSMAADWQRQMRVSWESRPPEEVKDVVRRHRLKKGRPDMRIPKDLLEHKGGIGVFLNPQEGMEILRDFDLLLAGLKRQGEDLNDEQEEAIHEFVEAEAISPAFVKRLLAEHGPESVRTAFRLPQDPPEYWLEYLLRSRKGHFYRKRYPSVSVV